MPKSKNDAREMKKQQIDKICKSMGKIKNRSNCRGIKLMSHTIKIRKRVIEKVTGDEMKICEQQQFFMPEKSTSEALFALKMLMEKLVY